MKTHPAPVGCDPAYLRLVEKVALVAVALWALAAPPFASAADGSSVRVLSHTGHRSPVTAVALLGEKGLVVSGGDDRLVIVWDAQSGAVLQRIKPRARV